MSVLALIRAPEAQEKIVVAYSGVSAFQGPLWAFVESKKFSKYGLTPEVVLINGGTQSMQALLSNSVQFALGSATPAISVRLQGGNVAVIGAALNKFPYSLVAQKEIDKPSKLVGKKIGIVNFGGSNDLAIGLALKEWGLSRQAVTLLRSGDTGSRFIALSNKVIDATLLSEPFTSEAKRLGFNILAHMGDMEASFPMTVVVVNRFFLEQRRSIVKQFMRGYSEAVYDLMHSKELGMRIFGKYLKQQDPKILEETYDDIAGKFSFPPRINRDGMRNALSLVSQSSTSVKAPGLDQFVDESVINELEREGFFKTTRK